MKKLVLIPLIFILAGSVNAQNRQAQLSEEEQYLASMHRYITSDKLFDYLMELSDSTLQGRLVGTPGMAKAVDIVVDYFKKFGLEPLGDRGGYVQEYPNICVEIGYGSTMSIFYPVVSNNKKESAWLEKTYPWADGWFAGNYSGNGDITADVVYCGFGVTAPELGYDDYKGVDVRGKIVLIEGETPNRSREPEDIAKWYKHTLHQTKLQNAADHGAIGILYKWVPGPNALYNPDLIYCHVTQQVVDDIFIGTDKSYKEVVDKIYSELKPQSFNTGKRARIKMVSKVTENATGKNIFGMVRGSDPELADEYVIVSGHLDHLGMLPYHIAGSNDNVSCVAAMLGAAEALANATVKPKRSVIFFIVDGEEAGLTGSTWFTEHPVVPKDKIIGIINLEQVGTGSTFGASYDYLYPGFERYLRDANDSYIHRGMRVSSTRYLTRPRTDGAVFMKAGYPCVDFRGGGGGYYHHPKDNPDAINPEMLQTASNFIYWTLIKMANDENIDLTKR